MPSLEYVLLKGQLRKLLRNLAATGRTSGCTPIATMLGVTAEPWSVFWRLLREIDAEEVRAGRPMLSWLIHNASSPLPQGGCYRLAAQLGVYHGDQGAEIVAIMRQRAWDFYSTPSMQAA